MQYQIETIVTAVSKADDATEARKAALSERRAELKAAASMGWTLTNTAVLEGIELATFVDTITYTPPAE
ncbi:hypothetical protein [Curtobacterium sp. PhB146]|uniref:hypothetical protein n=1 Tax=Curtobacterium sp. PhB146 TaxID=2485187 RepID=UPI001053FD2D|nr:hypothetical protein [Curtobacterium sp. PhB146]TCU43299.1 hypothetical protein EDF33_10938 [Curtobacterium sp. PhB146]